MVVQAGTRPPEEVKDESAFIKHCPCPACGSSDGNALYTDGHTYCHVCNHYDKGDGSEPSSSTSKKGHRMADLIQGTVQALSKRGITEETCRKFGYSVGRYGGGTVQIAEYRDKDGAIVAQKLRTPGKDFSTLGEFSEVALFGAHLWGGGKAAKQMLGHARSDTQRKARKAAHTVTKGLSNKVEWGCLTRGFAGL